MAKTSKPVRRVRPGHRSKPPTVEVVTAREQLQVWLRDGNFRKLTGSVRRELALDAERHGQDLVARLVDRALREADRRTTAP
jgi:hypothetical protein